MNTSRFIIREGYVFLALLILGRSLFGPDAEAQTSPKKNGSENLLTSRYSEKFLAKKMVPRDQWRPFPIAADRQAWEELQNHPLNRRRRVYVVGRAESLLDEPWPALPATLYMEYIRDGNRSRYQDPYFKRRDNLAVLVLAECMEHRGRFLDEIANGIWAICEESTWCIPAHAARLRDDALHRNDIQSLDLFQNETGMTLALTRYLLREELDAVSPALCDRIEREVKRRIVDVYAAGDDFGRASTWLDGHNNWAPWCASNILGAFMLLEENPERLAASAYRLMEVVDRFIDRYGADGGCDEGPGYWNEAAGALLIFLELLHSRTNGAVDIYDAPKIAAMGRFITSAHLDGQWFANFADADTICAPHPGKVYRFGERVGSDVMRNFALLFMRGWDPAGDVDPPLRIPSHNRAVLGPLMELFWIPPDAAPVEPRRETAVWLPDVQHLYARESAAPGKGLVFAAKGGHNAESHNHNDLGHFMLFLDGHPGVIDIGRESYTRQTFSSRRYELWFTRGLSHNAPVVNGIEQAPGREYKAERLEYTQTGEGLTLSMQIEKAYPKSAGIRSLRRQFDFGRGANAGLRVEDSFAVEQGPVHILIPLFVAEEVKRLEEGRLAIQCGPRRILFDYEPETMKATIESVPIADGKLRKSWGDRIYRVALEVETASSEGVYAFSFRAE